MRIAVISAHEKVLCFLDSDLPGSFYNDSQETVLDGKMWTMDFEVSNQLEDSKHLQVGNHIAWRDEYGDWYGIILRTDEDAYTKTVHVETLGLELLNEMALTYEHSGSFSSHITKIGAEILDIKIGINEISDKTRMLKFESEETVLKRIMSIAKSFDAEIEFKAELNNDYTLKHYTLNVYRKHSETDTGMGRTHPGFLRDGLISVTRTADISELYTFIEPTGKDGLKITSMPAETIKDENGIVLYKHDANGSAIYAPKARDTFPATFSRFGFNNDLWIAYRPSYDYSSAADLYGHALSELKKHSVPKMSYQVEGNIEGEVGDVVTIIDEKFDPELVLSCRIIKTKKSRTNPASNSYELDNFSEMFKEVK